MQKETENCIINKTQNRIPEKRNNNLKRFLLVSVMSFNDSVTGYCTAFVEVTHEILKIAVRNYV